MNRWAIGLIGCILVITLIEELSRIRLLHLIGNVLENIGQKSLLMYTVSTMVLSYLLPKVLSVVASNHEQLYMGFISNGIVFNIVMFILAITYAFIIYYIIKLATKLSISDKGRC